MTKKIYLRQGSGSDMGKQLKHLYSGKDLSLAQSQSAETQSENATGQSLNKDEAFKDSVLKFLHQALDFAAASKEINKLQTELAKEDLSKEQKAAMAGEIEKKRNALYAKAIAEALTQLPEKIEFLRKELDALKKVGEKVETKPVEETAKKVEDLAVTEPTIPDLEIPEKVKTPVAKASESLVATEPVIPDLEVPQKVNATGGNKPPKGPTSPEGDGNTIVDLAEPPKNTEKPERVEKSENPKEQPPESIQQPLTPVDKEKRKEPKKVSKVELVVVDIEEKLKRIAERIADERLDQEFKEIGPQGWKQLWRLDKIAAKWWKRNAMEGYREKYSAEILERLRRDPKYRAELMNLGGHGGREEVKPGYRAKLSGDTPAEGKNFNLDNELDAIAERFGISWTEQDRQYLTENESIAEVEAHENVQNEVRMLCRDYVAGTLSEDQFRRIVRERILPLVKNTNSPSNQELVAFLEEKTGAEVPLDQRKGLLDKLNAHKAGLIQLDMENFRLGLVMGKAKNVDVKTQVKDLGTIDRVSRGFVERIQKNKFLGRFMSPTTMAVIGYGVANIGAQMVASNTVRMAALISLGAMAPSLAPAIAGIAAGTLIGSGLGYFRKNKELMRSKAQKERRSAINYRREDDEKGIPDRLEGKLESNNSLYQKKSAQALIDQMSNAQTIDQLSLAIAEAKRRNEISEMGMAANDSTRMDLVSFDNETSIEKQRLDLMIAISRATVKLRNACTRVRANHVDVMARATDAVNRNLSESIATSDQAFRKFKRLENWKAAGIGGLVGAGFSTLVTALSYTHSPDTENLVNLGTMKDKAALYDALKARGVDEKDMKDLFDAKTLDLKPESIALLKDKYHINISQSTINAPSISSTTDIEDLGSNLDKAQLEAILAGKGVDVSRLAYNADGTLDKASQLYLENMKIKVELLPSGGTGGAPTTLDAKGFTTKVRLHFNANDPTGRVHTLDELRYYWNGKPQLGSDGNYHFHAKGVLNPSLQHSNLPPGVNMPTSNSQMQVALQVTQGGKHFWKIFPIDSSGDIKIPAEYFEGAVGHVARGGSVLPGLKTDALAYGFKDQNGVFQILSSVRGAGNYVPQGGMAYHVTSEVTKDIDNFTTIYQGTVTEITPGEVTGIVFPPLYGDRMSHLEYGNKKTSEGGGEGGGNGGTEGNDESLTEFPPTYNSVINKELVAQFNEDRKKLIDSGEMTKVVENDPHAQLNFNNESKNYFDRLKNKSPALYKNIESIANGLKLDPKSKAYVAIPCYIGEKNLERSLANFANQKNRDNSDNNNFDIVICLNGPVAANNAEDEKSFKENLSKRVEEINRVRAKHPNLKISVFSVKYPSKPNIGQVRAILTDSILHAAHRVGNLDPVIISNDADNLQVDEKYIDSLSNKFSSNQNLDYCLGQIEWDASYKNKNSFSRRCPELLIGQRMLQVTDAVIRVKDSQVDKRNIGSSGANTAFRGSSYLAVGGYDTEAGVGEDVGLGKKLKLMRWDETRKEIVSREHHGYSSRAKIQTSPRRALSAVINKLTVAEQWGNFQSKLGANWSDEDLANEYAGNADLVQTIDVQNAAKGDEVAKEKIVSKMEIIFKKLLMGYDLSDEVRIKDVMKLMKLKTTSEPANWMFVRNENGRVVDIKGFELDRSKVDLTYLVKYFDIKS